MRIGWNRLSISLSPEPISCLIDCCVSVGGERERGQGGENGGRKGQDRGGMCGGVDAEGYSRPQV